MTFPLCGIMIPHRRQARRSLKFMPKRGSDADNRICFDQLASLAASRLKATGAIRLEDRHGIIAFGDEDHDVKRRKSIGVAHTKFPNGGLWSYFVCPKCGGRKKKLWLVDDAPLCLSCCWSLYQLLADADSRGDSPNRLNLVDLGELEEVRHGGSNWSSGRLWRGGVAGGGETVEGRAASARLLALAAIYDGATRTEAAKMAG